MIDPLMIQLIDEITPAWLSTVLRQAGILNNERVNHIQLQTNEAFNSQVAHLQVSYSAGSKPGMPSDLLVKLNQGGDGEIEVEFYRQANHLTPRQLPMIVPCYFAHYDPVSGASCLLLDYRLMISYMLFDPVADLVRGSRPAYWQPKLCCLVDAYQDWHCQDL